VTADGFLSAGQQVILETVADLERDGFTEADRMPLRFSFEARGLRTAVDLAGTLRASRHIRVQLRPAGRRLVTSGRWNVLVTTPPAPLVPTVIGLWHEYMTDAAETHAGCAVVGWQPVVSRLPGP
jgi:hypothetical protein